MGGIAAAAAGGLMAFAAAEYEAAKSVGEAGVQVRDMELRMGVTDKQAAQLGSRRRLPARMLLSSRARCAV